MHVSCAGQAKLTPSIALHCMALRGTLRSFPSPSMVVVMAMMMVVMTAITMAAMAWCLQSRPGERAPSSSPASPAASCQGATPQV